MQRRTEMTTRPRWVVREAPQPKTRKKAGSHRRPKGESWACPAEMEDRRGHHPEMVMPNPGLGAVVWASPAGEVMVQARVGGVHPPAQVAAGDQLGKATSAAAGIPG